MTHAGQFGGYYAQLVSRFYAALEWRYNEVKDVPALVREKEIIVSLLDSLLADQVAHDVSLPHLESALRHFQKVRHDSFTPKKYTEILSLMGIEEKKTQGYVPQLYGAVTIDRHISG